MAILTRDTLQGAYRSLGAESQYEPTSGRLVGLTPFSYAAGTLPVIHDEQVSANVLIGHFGSEVALITNAIDQTGCLAIAGTDSVPAQAVLYATAEEPLIGEEVFAGGAYLGAGSFHEASLRTQDALRWLVIAFMLLAVLFKATGLDRLVTDILAGIFS
ncbi:MAG: hypothetical protein EHM70_08500 [Chloroflexota bacterium]|nr:MAG: hypothetical protein EHM70_08500 [Chloroflexota bacterium]